MQVSEYDNIKIYNLSHGKSLPEWLSERKRRALLKKDADLRKRINLIQDFEMPDISTSVKVTPDRQYIIATGIYKPRVKCFDVNNLSQKFDRCFDSEAITFEILSDDYSKLVFLQCDRYLEFHMAHGRHYRLRVPRYGRDMKMFPTTADLFIVGVTSDIYRLNLERGQFMTPFVSEASVINKCAINNDYSLVMCGTKEGKVECWDPRCRNLIGTLDVAFNCMSENKEVTLQNFPSITALNMDGPLHIGVGTASGIVLLYDIRTNKPYTVKDHMERLPIKDIEFNNKENIVFSMNKSILKMWDKNSGKPYANIEASSEFNNLCVVPDTGLLFIANEKPKILTYFLPSLGPAPKWASFLDSLIEELEESNVESIYDDYKFVTKSEINAMGLDLDDLVRNNVLRAYMHGYFMDARFYRKIKSAAQPFAFEEYKKNKIKQTIESSRKSKLKLPNLPKVNKKLALKWMSEKSNLLNDDRFKNLFLNKDFEIDENSEEYRLINHTVVQKRPKKELRKTEEEEEEEEDEGELEGKNSSDESSDELEESEESEVEVSRDVKESKKQPQKKRKLVDLNNQNPEKEVTLGERLMMEGESAQFVGSLRNRQMNFSIKKKRKDGNMVEKSRRHLADRKSISRKGMTGNYRNKKF